MTHEFIMAGFGGQGVMLMGQLMSYAGMFDGKHVSWMPSYGPEMRGGTANCSVVVSDQPVASPVVTEPTCAVVMNAPSLDKFAPTVVPGGCLLINSSLVTADPGRDDVKVFKVPANEIANELGNSRVANMVMLGAVAKATGAVPMERVEEALAKKMPARHKHLLDTNLEALRRGAACVE